MSPSPTVRALAAVFSSRRMPDPTMVCSTGGRHIAEDSSDAPDTQTVQFEFDGFTATLTLKMVVEADEVNTLKIGIAAALVGTIVGELPTGAISGLGARILIGDQFGTPLAIWAALFAAAILAGVLVTLLDVMQRVTLKRMGMQT